MTKIEQAQLDVIDAILEEGGSWSCGGDGDRGGGCLLSLAQRIYGDHVAYGSAEYKQTSVAVLMLEAAGLVGVNRLYRDEAQRANTITEVYAT